jgi:sulfonate transport system ATP-binding protein
MTGHAAAVVSVTSARRSFAGREVLAGIDLTIASGEFVVLLGHSGTGKSTLLRALAGLDDEVFGRLIVPRARAVVFQDARLVPWKGVLANIQLGATPEQKVRGAKLLDEVGLGDRAKAWPRTLSGGEAQRVALARALSRSPDLLLLDEPFGALDALTRLKMQGLLSDLVSRYRPAVLLVTHDVDEAIRLADRILVLSHGAIRTDLRVPTLDDDRVTLRTRLLDDLGVGEHVARASR